MLPTLVGGLPVEEPLLSLDLYCGSEPHSQVSRGQQLASLRDLLLLIQQGDRREVEASLGLG